MVGATAMVSTLVTVVGQPKTPTLAGKGGFRRGLPYTHHTAQQQHRETHDTTGHSIESKSNRRRV
jgi:hypothetical protein